MIQSNTDYQVILAIWTGVELDSSEMRDDRSPELERAIRQVVGSEY